VFLGGRGGVGGRRKSERERERERQREKERERKRERGERGERGREGEADHSAVAALNLSLEFANFTEASERFFVGFLQLCNATSQLHYYRLRLAQLPPHCVRLGKKIEKNRKKQKVLH